MWILCFGVRWRARVLLQWGLSFWTIWRFWWGVIWAARRAFQGAMFRAERSASSARASVCCRWARWSCWALWRAASRAAVAFEQGHGVGAGLDAQLALVAAVCGVLGVSHQAFDLLVGVVLAGFDPEGFRVGGGHAGDFAEFGPAEGSGLDVLGEQREGFELEGEAAQLAGGVGAHAEGGGGVVDGTGTAELEVVLVAVEGEEAAAEQQAVAGEGAGRSQGELVEGVGAEVLEVGGAEGGAVKVCHLSMVVEGGGRTSSSGSE